MLGREHSDNGAFFTGVTRPFSVHSSTGEEIKGAGIPHSQGHETTFPSHPFLIGTSQAQTSQAAGSDVELPFFLRIISSSNATQRLVPSRRNCGGWIPGQCAFLGSRPS